MELVALFAEIAGRVVSWTAWLMASDLDGNEYEAGYYGYTHNCNGMASKVLDLAGRESPHSWFDGDGPGKSWWALLDGQNAKESLEFLDLIIGGLNESPSFFREMNPDNGWGDYDQFIGVLAEMRARAADCPSARWTVSG